jgi:ABC-2 type transport system permease protein
MALNLGKSIRVAKVLLSVYYAYMVEYRAELLLWVLSNSFPIILMGLWQQATQSGNFALTSTEIIRYFLAVFIVRQFTVVWVIWDFERDVLEGKLSPRLLQPIDPGLHYLFEHLGERLARLPLATILIGFFFVLYPQALRMPTFGECFWGLTVTLLAFIMRFLMQYAFAMGAFWIERATAIEQFSFLFYIFLSGMMAPLELFPDAVREFALWTPFPYFIYFPARLWIGLNQHSEPGLGRGLLVMVLWIFIFWLINRWLWRRGLRHYSGMGA